MDLSLKVSAPLVKVLRQAGGHKIWSMKFVYDNMEDEKEIVWHLLMKISSIFQQGTLSIRDGRAGTKIH